MSEYADRLNPMQRMAIVDYARTRMVPSRNGKTSHYPGGYKALAEEMNEKFKDTDWKGQFTTGNCNRVCKIAFGPTKIFETEDEAEAASVAPEAFTVDAGAEIMKALAEHRTNTADSFAEVHKQLDEVLAVTRRLAEVWNIKK